MKKCLFAALFLVVFSGHSVDIRSPHCPLGCPSLDIPDSVVIFERLYALSLNKKTKFADWVAYEVNPVNFGPSPGRTWKNNSLLNNDEVLSEKDYTGAHKAHGYDKGHQAPLAAFAGNRYWYTTNYISNITPQKSVVNQKAWRLLEDAVRNASSVAEPLYVITGLIYEEEQELLPNAKLSHIVPSHYYKVIYKNDGSGVSFVMNQDFSGSYCESKKNHLYLVSRLGYLIPKISYSNDLMTRLGC